MKQIEIRTVCNADIPHLFDICLKTGDNGKDATSLFNDPFLLGHYYAAPYALYSVDFSFVAVDKDSGLPSGYVIGCQDTQEFYKHRKEYLSSLKDYVQENKNNKSDTEKDLKKSIYTAISIEETNSDDENDELFWCKEYPAHLHIDLLPSLQGAGLGHKMMQTFLENLRSKGIKGVHLGVSGQNKKACAFYEREGFKVLKQTDWGFWLGMKL